MKYLLAAALSFALWPVAAVHAAGPGYKIIDRIKVPNGDFDYATFDEATNRVYLALPGFTTVIDAKTGAVRQLNNASVGHMTLPIPCTTLVILPQRAGTVRIVDLVKDTVVAGTVVFKAGRAPAGGGRAQAIPGSYEVLVVGK